jgi:hypothetical protein
MAGIAACGTMATNTGRPVSGRERVVIGAAVRRVDTGLGDVDYLGLEDALLRIETCRSDQLANGDQDSYAVSLLRQDRQMGFCDGGFCRSARR